MQKQRKDFDRLRVELVRRTRNLALVIGILLFTDKRTRIEHIFIRTCTNARISIGTCVYIYIYINIYIIYVYYYNAPSENDNIIFEFAANGRR